MAKPEIRTSMSSESLDATKPDAPTQMLGISQVSQNLLSASIAFLVLIRVAHKSTRLTNCLKVGDHRDGIQCVVRAYDPTNHKLELVIDSCSRVAHVVVPASDKAQRCRADHLEGRVSDLPTAASAEPACLASPHDAAIFQQGELLLLPSAREPALSAVSGLHLPLRVDEVCNVQRRLRRLWGGGRLRRGLGSLCTSSCSCRLLCGLLIPSRAVFLRGHAGSPPALRIADDMTPRGGMG
mmetsp:Transcript_16417/g.41405  ORF Transcript_16417/g.41405 Transcript_16417/m.41405 type:complete len:239 (+) Transcript_16417:248-964(+)